MKGNVKLYLVFASIFIVLTACNQDERTEQLLKEEENTSPSKPVKKELESEQQEKEEGKEKQSDGNKPVEKPKDKALDNEVDHLPNSRRTSQPVLFFG